jgi:PRC-barrel domain
MPTTFSLDQLKNHVGHEVVDVNGESVGYVDLVFVDHETGEPEWLGVWNGVWDTRPRVLVPLQGVEAGPASEGGVLRLPWTKGQVEAGPSYDDEDDRGLLREDPDGIAISPEKERTAYAHYGVEPLAGTQPAATTTVRFRALRLEVRAPGQRW